MANPEYDAQVAVFEWAALNETRYPCLKLLFGSLMGIHLPPGLLNKARKAGMKKGKPDINLPVPRGGHCGLWIELKAGDNKPTPEQNETLQALYDEGNSCHVCWGSAATTEIIEAYVRNEIRRDQNSVSPEQST